MIPLIGGIIETGMKILDKVIPDPAQKAAAQLQLLQLQQNGDLEGNGDCAISYHCRSAKRRPVHKQGAAFIPLCRLHPAAFIYPDGHPVRVFAGDS
jgi:hypothetical protein